MRVLVFEVRGLNLGYIGCYGNEWVATPTLDRLASEAVVFDQHYADHPDPAAAHLAWLTGCYSFPFPEKEERPNLHEATELFPVLRVQGISTCLITEDRKHYRTRGVSGWERVHELRWEPDRTMTQDPITRTAGDVLQDLASLERWLLKLQFSSLLPPCHAPDALRDTYLEDEDENLAGEEGDVRAGDPEDAALRRWQAHYAAAVSYVDQRLGVVVEELAKRDFLDSTLLLITSDFGQALRGQGVESELRPSLHEEAIHIPLLVRLPGKAEAGRRIFALTQTVDLLPTLFDLFSLPVPEVHGHSLLPLLRGTAHHHWAYACSGLRRGAAIAWGLRTPEWSFLLPISSPPTETPERPELYVKPDDRWEVNNVLQHHQEIAEHLERTLRDFVAATRRPGPFRPPELGIVEARMAEKSDPKAIPINGERQP